MSTYTITASRRIPAPAATVYAIFADYHVAHPQVCPPKYFRNFVVQQGGTGAGTVLTFEMIAFGKARPTRCEVSEPEPGRVLSEWYPDTGIRTNFIIEPRDDGRACEVTFETHVPRRGGLAGALFGGIERALTTSFLHKVYAEELERTEAYALSSASSVKAPASTAASPSAPTQRA